MKQYTVSQAAAILGITTDGIRKAIERGKIKAHKQGTQWRINESDLNAYITNPKTRLSIETAKKFNLI